MGTENMSAACNKGAHQDCRSGWCDCLHHAPEVGSDNRVMWLRDEYDAYGAEVNRIITGREATIDALRSQVATLSAELDEARMLGETSEKWWRRYREALLFESEKLRTAEAQVARYREALTKVRANFNVAHKRAIERGDAVGTQWLDVEFLTGDALSLPPVADERTEP